MIDNDKAMNIIADLSPGDSIKLYVLRNGDRKVIDAVAGTRPKTKFKKFYKINFLIVFIRCSCCSGSPIVIRK